MKKKYPVELQENSKDCGAACLSMIIKYYGGNVPYEELKEKLEIDKNGIAASQMIQVAQEIGFEARGVEGDFSELNEDFLILPCIAHVLIDQSYYHYIVLFEINVKKRYFLVGDPAKGLYKMKFCEFENIWNHIILTFYPNTPIIYIEPNHILKNHFLRIIKKEKQPFFYILCLSIIITIFSILFSFMLEHFITLLDQHNEYGYLYFSFLLYALFLLVKNGSSFMRNKVFFHIYQRIDFQFMNVIFFQILHLPYRYYRNHTTGEMIARIEDIGVIRSFLATMILSSLMDVPLFISSGIFLYFISNQLFGISVLILLLYMIVFWIYQKRFTKRIEKVEEDSAKVTSYMVEVISGYETVFGSHLERPLLSQFQKRYGDYIQQSYQLESIQNEAQFLNQSIFDFSNLCILVFGIHLIMKEQLTIAPLLLFHSLFLYFIEPIRNLLRLGEEWKKVKVSWKRLSHLFHEQKELGIYEQSMQGNIKFQNVSFAYRNHLVLKHVSFHIQAGDKVLIVGESGNGKSTILKLLMKYYKTERNSIFIDDIDIMDYKEECIHHNIIYVSMKEQLFTGSIYQNILLENKINKEYQEILKLSETEEIISKTPLGHHLVLEENGANLSGGEKERVVLARSLLRPFQILLLDEATSQLDVNMERRILKRLFQRYPNQTIIMVSHRIDNVDLFDQKIEIVKGRVKKDVIKCE